MRTQTQEASGEPPEDEDDHFAEVVRGIADTPWMTPEQGRRVWDHIRRTRPSLVLDIGTCYGTSAAYMAAACRRNGSGRVLTVDSGQFDKPGEVVDWCKALWDRCDVRSYIDMVRIDDSDYAWWLMEQVATRTNEDGCEPLFDFVYLDGAKSLTLDAAAVIFIEQLLRPGGWLLMDDLDWTYSEHPELKPILTYPESGISYSLSDAQMSTAHLRAVFDYVVKSHPAFTQFVEQNGQWGWAQKLPGVAPRARIEVTTARPPVVDQVKWITRALGNRLRALRPQHNNR